MILGRVNAQNEAIVPLEVRGPNGRSLMVETLLDTGDTDALALLPEDIALLELPFEGMEEVILANGQLDLMAVHVGEVVWDSIPRETRVLATGGGALLGMTLLSGHRLIMDVCVDGEVRIQPLGVP